MMGVCVMSSVADKINDAIDLILSAKTDATRKEAATEAKRLVEAEVDDLEDRAVGEIDDTTLADAVNRFLDEVHRPVGTQTFDVPKTPAVDRALIKLHDAVTRSL